MKCSRCGSENSVKNGFVNGCQRYKCKRCGCQFTRPDKRENHLKERQLVALLYASGLSMNKIANRRRQRSKRVQMASFRL